MSQRQPEAESESRMGEVSVLPNWASVLAVVAHPDDESFGLGAVLDGFVRAGASVSVLCFTRGEASTLGSGPELRQVRAKELSDAADHLGIASTVLLDYGDGVLADVARDILEAEIRRELNERPADGIVVFDPSGITGHPDHTAATLAAMAVASSASLPVLAWTLPQGVADSLNDEFNAGFVGHCAVDVDLVVKVDRDRQRSASLCHTSQAVPGSALWVRLDLLGDHEHLRWLHRPRGPHNA